MKICFFTDFYLPDPNGVAENVALSAKSLEDRGHTVYIAAPKYPSFKDKDPRVIRLPSTKVYKNPEFRLFVPLPEKGFRRLTTLPADVFHGHAGGTLTILGWELSRLKNTPYVFTYHTLLNRYTHYIPGNLLSPKVAEVATKVYCNLTDYIIAPTTRVKKELLKYGVRKPISVIAGGVDLARFNGKNKDYLRDKLGLPKAAKILLYVGRLGKEKSVDFLLQTFQLTKQKRKDTWLVLVGDGPERKNLEQLAGRLKISDQVIFTGVISRDEIPLIYSGADLFVFASQTETQGLVVIEAMASGLPVVAVEDAAFEGVILDGKNGFLTRKVQEEFAQKTLLLLENPSLCEQFSLKAREHIVANFSAARQAHLLEKIYRQVIAEHQAKHRKITLLRKKILDVRNYLNLYQRFARFKGF